MRLKTFAMIATLTLLPAAAFAQSAPTAPATPTPPAAAAPSNPSAGGRGDNPEAKARFEKFRATCGADVKAHCGDIERGTDQSRAEMRKCIDTNKLKFSATCQMAVTERDAARQARKDAPAAAPGTTTPTEKPKS